MAYECLKCRRAIDHDVDYYTILCNECIEAGVNEADTRWKRIAEGDITVTDLTDEEKASILARRAEARENQKAATR